MDKIRSDKMKMMAFEDRSKFECKQCGNNHVKYIGEDGYPYCNSCIMGADEWYWITIKNIQRTHLVSEDVAKEMYFEGNN